MSYEDSDYIWINGQVNARALRLSQEEATAGTALLSVETQPEESVMGMDVFAREHPLRFIELVHQLPQPEDREFACEYWFLGIPQDRLAVTHRWTQSLCGSALAAIEQQLGALILLEAITNVTVRTILERNGLDKLEEAFTMTEAFVQYSRSRDFKATAYELRVTSGHLHSIMRDTAKKLKECSAVEERCLGAYLLALVSRASSEGICRGRTRERPAYLYKKDSPILGQFRVDVTHPDFGQLFSSRATHAGALLPEGISANFTC
jgi:hypothetical protein